MLWIGHDVYLEDYRRYTLNKLNNVLREAQLRLQFGSYYYGAILPMVAASRLLRRLLRKQDEPKSEMRQFGPTPSSGTFAASSCQCFV